MLNCWCILLGTGGPGSGIQIERPMGGEDPALPSVYNPNTSLSLNLQRQRLPIFKVRHLHNIIFIINVHSATHVQPDTHLDDGESGPRVSVDDPAVA